MRGDGDAPAPIDIRIAPQAFDPDATLADFRAANAAAGAIAIFLGQVRGENGRAARLELEHYPGFTEDAVAATARQAVARFALESLLVVHRVGALFPGEPIVLVAAAARHRRDAFAGAEFMMDHLKTDAPFWKREIAPGGRARWIEPRAEDRRDRARWREGET
jgi:molybdopterin synthase catalytic subunit